MSTLRVQSQTKLPVPWLGHAWKEAGLWNVASFPFQVVRVHLFEIWQVLKQYQWRQTTTLRDLSPFLVQFMLGQLVKKGQDRSRAGTFCTSCGSRRLYIQHVYICHESHSLEI